MKLDWNSLYLHPKNKYLFNIFQQLRNGSSRRIKECGYILPVTKIITNP
jgi:hypothetical protein